MIDSAYPMKIQIRSKNDRVLETLSLDEKVRWRAKEACYVKDIVLIKEDTIIKTIIINREIKEGYSFEIIFPPELQDQS